MLHIVHNGRWHEVAAVFSAITYQFTPNVKMSDTFASGKTSHALERLLAADNINVCILKKTNKLYPETFRICSVEKNWPDYKYEEDL